MDLRAFAVRRGSCTRSAGRLLAPAASAGAAPRLLLWLHSLRFGLDLCLGLDFCLDLCLFRLRLFLGHRLGLRFLRHGGLAPSCRRLTGRLLGLALCGDRSHRLLGAADQRRVGRAVEDALDPHLRLLADERSAAADADGEPVELADPRVHVVEADLDELQLDLLAFAGRAFWREALVGAFAEHLEVVGRHALARLDQEPTLRLLLDLGETRGARPDQDARDLCVELELECLRPRRARRQRAQVPFRVDRGRRLREDDAVAAADRALAREDLARPVGDVLARHLDEAERRDLDHVGLRPVALELVLERLLDRGAVLGIRHVDEVDDDDPADVAQPQLADDLLDRLEVVLRDRVFEPAAGRLAARADKAACVDVDDGERLGVVEDQVAAGGQVDAARERRADLGVDAVGLHQRRLLAVALDAIDHVGRGLLQVADDALVRALVIDDRALEIVGEEIADDAQRQLGLLVGERRCLRTFGARLDRLPEPLQEDKVALDVLGGGALGRGADDHAALLDVEALEDVAQADALRVLEPARDTEALAARDEDDEPARERDLGREPRALRLHRVLDRLDEHLLSAAQQVLDLAAVRAALELGDDDLVDVEEAVLLEADLDERGLHPRQDVVDDAEVDVARDRAALRPLEVGLGDPGVLEHRDALLADVEGDQELALRRRERRAARRRLAARGALLALGGLSLGLVSGLRLRLGLGLGLFGLRLGCARARARARARPLAAAAAATSASATLTCWRGLGCARFGGRGGYGLGRAGRRSPLCGALVG